MYKDDTISSPCMYKNNTISSPCMYKDDRYKSNTKEVNNIKEVSNTKGASNTKEASNTKAAANKRKYSIDKINAVSETDMVLYEMLPKILQTKFKKVADYISYCCLFRNTTFPRLPRRQHAV